jgi:ParB family chromosome partitioning protein
MAIPLNKLVPWDGNVRKTGAAQGLDELQASIAAQGLLQSLVVKKTSRGKFAVIAGRRRYLALSALAGDGGIAADVPVPCRVLPSETDGKEISLAENVVRAPMHPADQFEAFRDLIDNGSTPADIAARFGISETAVRQRLKLARVSPTVFEAYREGELTLEQVQAFTVSDDHAAQERVFSDLADWSDADDIRRALTQDDIAATDRRVQFVTLAAYEEADGAVRRDLFAEGDEGVFLLDAALLDRLVAEKLRAHAEIVKAEGWKWVEAVPQIDYSNHDFRVRRPERLPLSEEARAEHKQLSEEYHRLFSTLEEDDEEACARLDEIEAHIAELEDTESAYTPDVLAIAGAIVTIGPDGEAEFLRGLVRAEDLPEGEAGPKPSKSVDRPEYSASLVKSLTEAKSAATSASLARHPDIALAAVVHALALCVFHSYTRHSSLQISARRTHIAEASKGREELQLAHHTWAEAIPGDEDALWDWCLAQNRDTLLELLAHCAACTVNAVQMKHERPDEPRLKHARALADALKFDMTQWFTTTAANFFSRVRRTTIVAALTEAKGMPARRSWEKLKKAEFAALAEREIAGTGWLPPLLRA